MTIVDVALHKWRMLDDRRRKIIIGTVLICIIILVTTVIIIRSTGKSDQPEPDPSPTTTLSPPETTIPSNGTTTTTTTTSSSATSTTTTSTTEMPPGQHKPLSLLFDDKAESLESNELILAPDKSALASIKATLNIDGESRYHFKSAELAMEVSHSSNSKEVAEDSQFTRVTLKGASSEIEFLFGLNKTTDGKQVLEARDILVRWKNTAENTWQQCQIIRNLAQQSHHQSDQETANSDSFFLLRAEQGKHYKCNKSLAYDCLIQGSSDEQKGKNLLVIDSIEMELGRKEATRVGDNNNKEAFGDEMLKFETPAELCV